MTRIVTSTEWQLGILRASAERASKAFLREVFDDDDEEHVKVLTEIIIREMHLDRLPRKEQK